jgi:DNA-binding MarR family transcriptional regulator
MTQSVRSGEPEQAQAPSSQAQVRDEQAPTCPSAAQAYPAADQSELLQQWQTLYSGFRRLSDRLLADVESASGVDPSSFQVLWFLMTTPQRAAPMNLLARVLGFSTAGTTKVVDRLCEAGFVQRRPSPTDRRVTFAELTAAGMTAAAEVSTTLADALRRHLVQPLGAEQVAAFATALGSLDKSDDPCGSEC